MTLDKRLWKGMLLASLLQPVCALAQTWPDTQLSRTELLALLQSLNAELLSNNSATLVLDRWCNTHKMATPPLIVAERVTGMDKVPTAEQRKLLAVSESEPLKYRRVRLKCGDHILSEADNWYVPSRLTSAMNAQLESSNTSFGRVVADLKFRRQTLSAGLLWEPLPQGWEMRTAAPDTKAVMLDIPHAVLEHRAVLVLPDNTPFSALVETYTKSVLDFRRAP